MAVGCEYYDMRDGTRMAWLLVLEQVVWRGVPSVGLVRNGVKRFVPAGVFAEYWKPVGVLSGEP